MREMTRLLFNKRFRQTFFMFVGFFAQFWWLGKTKRLMSKEKSDKKYHRIYRSQAKKFTVAAVEMGGLIIKLGQFVSSRVDILPKEYTDTLSELQDSVTPVESELIVKRVEDELGGTVAERFADFARVPVAAASLGQVHKAVLHTGETVAVKVMRPGIESIVALDLVTMKVLIAFARRFTKVDQFVDLAAVYQEFDEVIHDELDYLQEAKNIARFRENFKAFPGVTVPDVYHDFTTSNVLVMEFIEGVKINEVQKNKRKVASILYLTYLKQLLEDGFFHADPHPGNILVKRDGTVAFIDFGMVGTVSDTMKSGMFKLALAVYLKDATGLVEAFDELGLLRNKGDKAALTKNVKRILAGFSEAGFEFNNLNDEVFLEELRAFLYTQPFQIPSRTTFLGKAIITVFSICKGLDEDFDFVGLAKPFVEDMMTGEKASAGKETILNEVKNIFRKILPASRKLFTVIDQLESGDITINPSKSYQKTMLDQQAALNRKIVYALFGSSALIAGAQIVGEYYPVGMIMMIGGGLITIFQAFGKTGAKRRRHRHGGHSFRKEK